MKGAVGQARDSDTAFGGSPPDAGPGLLEFLCAVILALGAIYLVMLIAEKILQMRGKFSAPIQPQAVGRQRQASTQTDAETVWIYPYSDVFHIRRPCRGLVAMKPRRLCLYCQEDAFLPP